MILINTPLFFQDNKTSVSSLNDFHKLTSTFFKCQYSQLKPKAIRYKNYTKFNEAFCLFPLTTTTKARDCRKTYSIEKEHLLSTKCLEIKYTKAAVYEIFTRKILHWKTSFFYKKQSNKYVSLRKNLYKNTFKKLPKMVLIQISWNSVKSFSTNKSNSSQYDIVLIEKCKSFLRRMFLVRSSMITM